MENEGVEWRQYIRPREDWQDTVGTGVVACEFCSVIVWDRRAYNRWTGILVTRSDGSSVCSHPPEVKHTKRYEAHAMLACPDLATARSD